MKRLTREEMKKIARLEIDRQRQRALIDAAPELYAACVAVLEHGTREEFANALDLVQSAIDKARSYK